MLKRAVYLCNTNNKLSEVWAKLEFLPRYLYFTYIYHYLPNCSPSKECFITPRNTRLIAKVHAV